MFGVLDIEIFQNADWMLLKWIQSVFSCKFLDFVMPYISVICNHGEVWILTAVVLLFIKKYRKNGIILAIGLIIGVLIGNLLLKNIIARDRPSWLDSSVSLLISNPTDFSFPSGHTLSSTIAATILTMSNRKFGAVAIPLAILIAFSRMYLYVHFPSDILFAAILGFVIGFFTFVLFVKMNDSRNGTPITVARKK